MILYQEYFNFPRYVFIVWEKYVDISFEHDKFNTDVLILNKIGSHYYQI